MMDCQARSALYAMTSSSPALIPDASTLLKKGDADYFVFETPPDKAAVSGIQRIIVVNRPSQDANDEFHVRIVYERAPKSLQPMLAISFDPPTFNSKPQQEEVARKLRLEEEEEEPTADAIDCTVQELLYKLSKQAQHMVSEKQEMKIKRRKLDNSQVRIGNEVRWRVTKTGAPLLLLEITYSYWTFEHESEVVQLIRMFLDAANMRDVKASGVEHTTHAL